jgi:hypothetical protein
MYYYNKAHNVSYVYKLVDNKYINIMTNEQCNDTIEFTPIWEMYSLIISDILSLRVVYECYHKNGHPMRTLRTNGFNEYVFVKVKKYNIHIEYDRIILLINRNESSECGKRCYYNDYSFEWLKSVLNTDMPMEFI